MKRTCSVRCIRARRSVGRAHGSPSVKWRCPRYFTIALATAARKIHNIRPSSRERLLLIITCRCNSGTGRNHPKIMIEWKKLQTSSAWHQHCLLCNNSAVKNQMIHTETYRECKPFFFEAQLQVPQKPAAPLLKTVEKKKPLEKPPH